MTTSTQIPDRVEADPAERTGLTRSLEQLTANLDDHIAEAAERLAAPRIEAAETAAAERVASLEAEYTGRLRQAADLETELRRQLDAQLRQVARLRWTARFLPAPLRVLVLRDPLQPGAWSGDRPDDRFRESVDAAAAAAAVTAYPGWAESVGAGR